jgi:hypothetical protein
MLLSSEHERLDLPAVRIATAPLEAAGWHGGRQVVLVEYQA